MKRMAVVTVGFRDYAMSMSDATTLMTIAQRVKEVERGDFGSPFSPVDAEGGEPFARHMEIAMVQAKRPVIPKSHRLTYETKTGD